MELEVFREKIDKLLEMKKRIDTRETEWEQIKHNINPLEFVFTFIKGESVSRVIPVSRAFFKMIEILHLIQDFPEHPIRTLHLAEGPGGFIQALNWTRRNIGIMDDMTGWTLPKGNAWKKLEEVSLSWTSKPVTKLGNLLLKQVRDDIINRYSREKAFFISGDGGFDFSDNYESQERLALPLVLAQSLVGIQCLQDNGIFVLKIFDCYTLPTIQLLWVLWKVFKGFRIIKPQTSRACNSEKYVIARGFRGITEQLQNFIDRCNILLDTGDPINSLFPENEHRVGQWDTMEQGFKDNFRCVIGKMMDDQTAWIQRGLDSFVISREKKIELAIQWCRTHSIPINPEYYQKHPLLQKREETYSQENRLHFSLRRRLASVSPPLFG